MRTTLEGFYHKSQPRAVGGATPISTQPRTPQQSRFQGRSTVTRRQGPVQDIHAPGAKGTHLPSLGHDNVVSDSIAIQGQIPSLRIHTCQETTSMDPKHAPRPLTAAEFQIIARIGTTPFSSQSRRCRIVGAPEYSQRRKAMAKAR